MRKRFKLPENRFCCGSASLTDYVKWMFCWSCALAQEVRTGNFYDVEDDSLFRRPGEGEVRQPLLSSFMSESGSTSSVSISCEINLENSNAVEGEDINTSLAVPDSRNEPVHSLERVEELDKEESLVVSIDDMMAPPVLPLMKVGDEDEKECTSLVVKDAIDDPVVPLVKVEDGMGNVEEKGSFVRTMEFGLLFFVVIVYTMGSIILH